MLLQVATATAASAYIIPAVITAVGSVVGGVINWLGTKHANEESLDYARDANAESWEHSQVALQTKVADAKKAGLSPLAALGSTGSQVTTPLQYQAQAPQMDFSQLLSSITSLSNEYNSNETKKAIAQLQADTSYKTTTQDNATRLKINRLTLENNLDIAKRNISSQEKIAQGQLDEQARQADNRLNLDFLKFNQSYALELENSRYQSAVKDQEIQLKAYYNTADNLGAMCKALDVPFRVEQYDVKDSKDIESLNDLNSATFKRISDAYDVYDKWRNSTDRTNEDFAKAFNHSTAKGSAHWKDSSLGANFNANSPITGNTGNMLGSLGAGAGVNGSQGSGESSDSSLSNGYTFDKSKSDMKLSELFRNIKDGATGQYNKPITYYVPRYQNSFYRNFGAVGWSPRSYERGSIRR